VGAVALERCRRRRSRGGKKREGGSGRGNAMRRGTASWGLAPTGRRRPDRVSADRDPDAMRAGGASLFRQRRSSADRAGPGGSESGEAQVARGRAWAGPRRKRGG
jgi:hypothetical protein